MLLIPVRVDRSQVHGLGVFAVHRIAKETRVWRFTAGFDLDLDLGVLDEQPLHFCQSMLHDGYIDPRLNRFILRCEDCRFINHSDAPNVRVVAGADAYGLDVAARDIEPGEELTVDYGLVEGYRPR